MRRNNGWFGCSLEEYSVTVIKLNSEVITKERIKICKAELRRSLEAVPQGSRVFAATMLRHRKTASLDKENLSLLNS